MNKPAKELELEKQAVVPIAEAATQELTITPMQMVQAAIQQNFDIEKLKAVLELERNWKADNAREAFVKAMSGFRGEAVEVFKTRKVSYETSQGGTTSYMHAELADAVQAAVPALSKWELSHRWETKQADGLITVDCIITHSLGHSEKSTLMASPDTSGGKNSIQAIGSTICYLERYTFMAATGLAAKGMDDDGGGAEPVATITKKQVADLEALISEIGAKKAAFLKTCKIDKLENLPAKMFKGAVARLEQKRKQ